jgi:isocitrate dehydrogenase kinase/phosphatase
MTGAAIANPADLMKVRMQAPNNTMRLRDHFADIYRTAGLRGFYRAVLPTVFRAGLLTSFQLGTYDHAKHTLLDSFPATFEENFQTHFIASGIAGLVCSVVTAPVDMFARLVRC